MELVFIVIAFLVIIAGIGGCVLPVIPGPPIAYIGLLVLHFGMDNSEFSTTYLVVHALFAIAITVLDYVVPVWGTKKFGGSKYGTWGSTIGLIVGAIVLPAIGLVLGPFGLISIILGPFVGAVVGELIGGMDSSRALRAGVGAFIGFLAGTFMKLVYCFAVLYAAIMALV